MKYSDKQIGRNIKAIRNANKMNYADFGGAIGISESMLQKIENGAKTATDQVIQRISKLAGFPFNDIKYKDLTYLEKGELYFKDDLSIADFTEECELETLFINVMKIQFPIVKDEKALENTEFSTGIQIAHEKIQSGVFSSKECITAINHFIRAGKQETCAGLSAINILSCFGYLYLHLYDIASLSSISSPKINSLFDYLFVAHSSINQSKLQNMKKSYLAKYNGFLTKYMRKLVESKEHSDYAYYFLCLRYWLGIMDERITMLDDNQMSRPACVRQRFDLPICRPHVYGQVRRPMVCVLPYIHFLSFVIQQYHNVFRLSSATAKSYQKFIIYIRIDMPRFFCSISRLSLESTPV